MSEQNKALVRRWHEDGINQQNAGLALELCTEDFRFHFAFVTPDYPPGAAALQHWASATFEFFPDFHVTIEDMLSEHDKVAFRVTITATHGGEIFGVAPTGKQLSWGGMGIFQIENGKLAEFWWMPDLFTLMQQLDLVPESLAVKFVPTAIGGLGANRDNAHPSTGTPRSADGSYTT